MEEAIKIQEEFENLITQLERLRNINELTSANAESAQSLIAQIESFIQSTNEFKNLIEHDINLKNVSIQQLIDELSSSINSLNNQSEIIQRELNSSLNGFTSDTNNKLNEIDNSLKIRIENIQNEVNSLENSFSGKLVETQKDIIKASKEQTEEYQLKTNKESEALKSLVNRQGKEIKSLKTIMIIIGALVVLGTIITILFT